MELYAELAKTLGVPAFICFILIMAWNRHSERQDKRQDKMVETLQEQTQLLKAIREAQILEHFGASGLRRIKGIVGAKGGGMTGAGRGEEQHQIESQPPE